MDNNYFSETRDIYLEILQDAQKVEDRKLIQLIGTRLRESCLTDPVLDNGCEIIPFPGVYSIATAPPPGSILESGPFWPRFCFRHTLWVSSGYVALLLGGLFI